MHKPQVWKVLRITKYVRQISLSASSYRRWQRMLRSLYSLFVPQCAQRVYSYRAPGRYVVSDESNHYQQ